MKRTHEMFVEELLTVNPNIIVIGKYIDSQTKLECKCKTCGYKWSSRPYDLLNGHGCKECAIKSGIKKRKKSLSVFVQELAKINFEIEIIGEYFDTHTPVLCKCKKCGYEWKSRPNDLLQGKGCARCAGRPKKDTAYFAKELRGINPTLQLDGEYINSKTKIKTKCTVCGYSWSTLPTSLLRGKGCPQCMLAKRTYSMTKSHTQFIRDLKKVNPSIIVKEQYKNNKTKLECFCSICGHSWNSTPNSLLRGEGCPQCGQVSRSKKRTKKLDVFLSELSAVNPNVHVIGEYVNSRTPILCICTICSYKWAPIPNTLLRGSGCPNCAGRPQKSTLTFVDELKEINSEIEVIGDYINSHTPITVRCKNCDYKWDSVPYNLLNNHGCPICSHANTSYVSL